jgi:hypothetical protein
MRAAVMVLGILGCVTAGYFSFIWLQDLLDPDLESTDLPNWKVRISRPRGLKPEELQEAKDKVAYFQAIAVPSYLLLAAIPLGLAGAVLGLKRRSWLAGILMLLAVPGPIIFVFVSAEGSPPQSVLLGAVLGTAPLFLGGILAFFIPRKAPAFAGEPLAA